MGVSDEIGMTALHYAVARNNLSCIITIIETAVSC